MADILYFASLAETLGIKSEQIELSVDCKTVDELVKLLIARGEPFAGAFGGSTRILVAINQEAEIQEIHGEEVDAMFDQAIAIVAETRNASISYIQRRLKVGYNRAARMIEQMENEGIVGPQIGSKQREVFVQAVHADGDVN